MSTLTKIAAKLKPASDLDLGVKLAALQAERDALIREHSERTREDRHELLDRHRAGFIATAESRAASWEAGLLGAVLIPGPATPLRDLAELWQLGHDDSFWAFLHGRVDEAVGGVDEKGRWDVSPMPRAELVAKLTKLNNEIAEIEAESRRRGIEGQIEVAKTELEELEQKIA